MACGKEEDGIDGWMTWCEANDYGSYGRSHFATEFRFRKDADVLLISTEDELLAFTSEFRSNFPSTSFIDWVAVAARYRGIVIAPYQWSLRLDRRCGWYYSWDVASACVWDVSCLERIDASEMLEAA